VPGGCAPTLLLLLPALDSAVISPAVGCALTLLLLLLLLRWTVRTSRPCPDAAQCCAMLLLRSLRWAELA
jgi:hypothetical protein